MVGVGVCGLMCTDPFAGLARFYNGMMAHVDYDRWALKSGVLAEGLEPGFLHLDVACGTGTLAARLRKQGWRSLGIDLSWAMVSEGKRQDPTFPAAVADMRGLPFRGEFEFVTCLFDSLNFLLELEDLRRAFAEIAGCMRPGGLFYGDIITERMVLAHFAGQEWTEENGRFTTTWSSRYSRKERVAETAVTINRGQSSSVRERIFTLDEIESCIRDAGLELLGFYDAITWKKPRKRSIRVDIVAAKPPAPMTKKAYAGTERKVQLWLC